MKINSISMIHSSFVGIIFWVVLISFMASCKRPTEKLPVIGDREDVDGTLIEHSISDFKFVNQLGDTVTNTDYANKVYMTDFFFLSCPSICPKVKKQMLRIHEKIEEIPDVMLVSHTIDPKRDDVEALKTYADNINIKHDKWHFLTGDKEDLMDMADDYFIAAYEDENAPGGFDHSGKIIMVDKKGKIRSFCDGTDPESVDGFMKDLDILLSEYKN